MFIDVESINVPIANIISPGTATILAPNLSNSDPLIGIINDMISADGNIIIPASIGVYPLIFCKNRGTIYDPPINPIVITDIITRLIVKSNDLSTLRSKSGIGCISSLKTNNIILRTPTATNIGFSISFQSIELPFPIT